MAIAAIIGEKTTSEIAGQYEVHPSQIGLWKKQALESMQNIFSDKRRKENWEQQRMIDELYKALGQRELELGWLKKKLEPFGPP